MAASADARVVVAALFLLMEGCAGPSTPPLLALEGRTCLAETSLAGAKEVTLNAEQPVAVKVTLDGSTPCWQKTPGAGTPYAVFKLPDAKEPYLVGITSVPIGTGLVPPSVFVLDADGKTLRERPRDSFMFHGASLYAGLRVQPGDRYILVVADTDSVGKSVSHTVGSVNAQVVPAGPFMFMMYQGAETVRSLTFAYNGALEVRAEPMPKVGNSNRNAQ